MRVSKIWSFLRALLSSRRVEHDMEHEWQFHIDARVEDLMGHGMSRPDAERQARREFGDTLRWKEQTREVRGVRLFDELRQDVTYGTRQMARAPGFTAVAVLTLALGIGATTAIFSVVNAVLLRPLPYDGSERLVRIVELVPASDDTTVPQRRAVGLSLSDLVAFRTEATTFSHVGAYAGATPLVANGGDVARLDMVRTSPALFEMIGVRPLIGRSFEPNDETPGRDDVVILSHALWQRLFGGAPDVLGRPLAIDARSYVVIGVMPPDFQFPDAQTQLWIPYAIGGASLRGRVAPLARLADGVSLQAATEQMNTILPRLQTSARPPTGETPVFAVEGIQEQIVAPVRPALTVLVGAVGVVLLIACVNVANLLMARTTARHREIAVRLALGAGRGRVLRQLLTESLLLAIVAGVAGVGLAFGGVALLRTFGASLARRDMTVDVSIPRLDEIGLDWTALAFALAAVVVAGVLSGMAPAFRQSRASHADALRQGGASNDTGFNLLRRHRAQGLLVVAEIAMAMVLLVGAGLLMRSFVKLSSVDPGFDAANVLTFNIYSPRFRSPFNPNPPGADEAPRPAIFAETFLSRLKTLPGVTDAGYTEILPLVRFRVGARLRKTPEMPATPPPPPSARGTSPESPDIRVMSHEFMAAMGMRIVAGRGFDESDGAGRPLVMLINRALARSGFFGPDPIGERAYAVGSQPWEVIGIVDDVRQYGLDREPDPQIFFDIRQVPSGNPNVYYAVRTTGPSSALVPAMRGIAMELEPQAILDNVATMEQLVANSISRPRLYTVLLGVFAAVAVTLAVIGIYGAMAYAVTQRTREIGIRVALGAERSRVTGLVLGQSLILIAIGMTVGLAGAAAGTRYLQGMLFGLTPLDAPTFAAMALLFAGVALVAAIIPARRATKVDPLVALRCE
jgi:predicted permease